MYDTLVMGNRTVSTVYANIGGVLTGTLPIY